MPVPDRPTCSVFIATSLDGFIARPNGELDWLPGSGEGTPEPADEVDPLPADGGGTGYDEFIATVDGIVLGRFTYEKVLTFGGWFYTKPVFVLSRNSVSIAPELKGKVERLTGSPQEVLEQLGRRGMKHLYVDGGVTIQRFLRAGLIQRLTITRVPVLLGQGIPLFGPLDRDIRLCRVSSRTLGQGLVQEQYEVRGEK